MSWYRIVNASKNKARIDIYDDIGEFQDWWTGEKTGLAARDFSATLAALDVGEIELHINSRGGSVPDGIQIYNELRRHKARVTVVIDGQAASIASIVAMAGDEVVMPSNTTLWIHDPMAFLDIWGYSNADELRAAATKTLNLADDLDTTRDILVNTYLTRANDTLTRDELIAMMARETTITAEQAIAWGLADRIEEPLKQAACHDMRPMRERARDAVQARADAIAAEPEEQDTADVPETPAPAPEPEPEPEPVPALDPDAVVIPATVTAADLPALNTALAARGVTLHAAQTAMDPRTLVDLCQTEGFLALVPGLLASRATETEVRSQIAQAARLRDRMQAAGLAAHFDATLNSLRTDPVDAICLAYSYRMVEGESAIRSDHGALNGPPSKPPPNVLSIQAARKAAQRKQP